MAVFFLSLFTLGIYAFIWHVKTKGELTRLGADIPTSWLLIVPFANLYWIWKYSEGVDKVTGGKVSTVMALLLLLLLSIVGIAILQDKYNNLNLTQAPLSPGPVPSSSPTNTPAQPMPSTSAPVATDASTPPNSQMPPVASVAPPMPSPAQLVASTMPNSNPEMPVSGGQQPPQPPVA